MSLQGCAPLSSSLYMTKRAKLSDSLIKNRGRNDSTVPTNVRGDITYASNRFRLSASVAPKSEDFELRRALVELALRKLKLSPLDPDGDEHRPSSRDGLDEGLKYLSHQRCLRDVKNRIDVERMISGPKIRSTAVMGRLDDIYALLDPESPRKAKSIMSKRVATGTHGIETSVGPLSANEVAHLLLLAQKLQDTSLLDDTLERNIEMSANVWKQTGKVSNVVGTAVVMGLYEGKLAQCPTCGLRFSTHDARYRHATSHDGGRREVLWSTMDEWVTKPVPRSTVRIGQKAVVTVQSLTEMLKHIDETASGNIKWLASVIFSKREAISANTDVVMDSEPSAEHQKESESDFTGGSNDALRLLWSWGTMTDCTDPPMMSIKNKGPGIIGVDCDLHLLMETWHKAGFNISRFTENIPFPLNYADLTRKTCAICYETLSTEFNITYNCSVYSDAVCFKIDSKYLRKAFQDEHVSCRMLLGTTGLGDTTNAFLVLRKLAGITLLKSALRSRRRLEFADWSFKGDVAIIEDKNVIPERKGLWTDSHKLMEELVNNWKGPFCVHGDAKGVPNGLMYGHRQCMRFVINAHVRRANELLVDVPFPQGMVSLKLV
ncbi:uncharacterized protein BXIN_0932 [Babesia sp. Xinjiang]|uniref:uncharacterized protein n=1 Tax=Babesia sp. Xinjiang TaxID=462227 RepID=UPI000A25C7CC|nr:uncharacterized protein BXIN_0932 [Babesia sp. Xinjiang]ORM42062.1 hypothetical protein BXIN_0932 [Babesia sp. Xinjiang]